MAATRKLHRSLAIALTKLPIICRIEVFNEIVPVLKEDNPRFNTWKFYEAVFGFESEVEYDDHKFQARST